MDNLFFLVIAGTLGILIIVCIAVVIQVNSSNRLLRQRQAMAEAKAIHRDELASAFIRSQEKERKRIGMDLHDEVGTALSTLRIQWLGMASLQNTSADEGKRLIDQVIANIRRISHDLSPFIKGAYGLREALEEMGDSLTHSGRIKAQIDTTGLPEMDTLPDESQLAIYRILSELVQNTLKHARATSLSIHFIKKDKTLEIDYTDDGIGLPTTAGKGMGLSNIESRLHLVNGSSQIDPPTGKGFSIHLFIPIV